MPGVDVAQGCVRYPIALLDEPYRSDVLRHGDTVMEVALDLGSLYLEQAVVFKRWGHEVRSEAFRLDQLTDDALIVAVGCEDLHIRRRVDRTARLGETFKFDLRVETADEWDFAYLMGAS